jgi:hypothetical protein
MLNAQYWLSASRDKSPFIAGDPGRHLCLLVCDDELDRSPALDLLQRLGATRPRLDVLSATGAFGGRFAISPNGESIDFAFKDSRQSTSFVPGTWWRRAAAEASDELGIAASTLERRLLLAHTVSRSEWIDAIVAPFPEPLIKRWGNLWVGAPVRSGEEATALAGLYLRANGDFTVAWEQGTSIHERPERFYRLAASSLLGGARSWLSAAMEHWRQTGDPALFELADGVIARFARGLKARDYLHVRARATDREEVWDDVLFFFEALLVSLQGALDATARYLHLRYELNGSVRRANWGWKDWRAALDASDAPTEQFDNARLWRLDVLVGELRNAIHGAILSSELREPTSPGENPAFVSYLPVGIAIEPQLASTIATAAEAEDEVVRWLPQRFSDGVGLIDPWSYAERAVATVAKALSSVINPIEEATKDSGIPAMTETESGWSNTEARRASIAALVGIGRIPLR